MMAFTPEQKKVTKASQLFDQFLPDLSDVFDGDASGLSFMDDPTKLHDDCEDVLDFGNIEHDDMLPVSMDIFHPDNLFSHSRPNESSSAASQRPAYQTGPSTFCMPEEAWSASSAQGNCSNSLISLVASGRKQQAAANLTTQATAAAAAAAAAAKTRRNRRPNPKKTMTLLPEDFQPSQYSVLCGKGKENFEAPGNRRFRVTVQMFLQQYIDAKDSQTEKSAVVKRVMDIMTKCCPVGAFVTQKDGLWYEVDIRTAREKVGAFFRDCLADHYKSSAKNKVARRKQIRAMKQKQPEHQARS